MPRSFKKLYSGDILRMFRLGIYRVDPETGNVYNGSEKPLRAWPRNGHYFVRLHFNGGRIGVARARLVWMWVTRKAIPHKFEVHHRDEEPTNDCWRNLICIHELDHKKLHEDSESDETPF